MSPSSRLRGWIAIVAAAALAGCSGAVTMGGGEDVDDGDGDGESPGAPQQVDGQKYAERLAPEVNDVGQGCGNGFCTPNESCSSCPADCGDCPPCGDGVCEPGESCDICAADCGACPPPVSCGNGVCTPNESCSSCPADCGACPCDHATCTAGTALEEACDPCVAQICAVDSFCCDYSWDAICVSEVGTVCGTPCPTVCGDNMCSAGESCSTCAADCGACPVCGDGICDWNESCDICAADCGACPVCGDGTCDWSESCSSCDADCGACVCHDNCQTGPALDASCGTCEAQICAVDSFCCAAAWDSICVSEVGTVCGTPCAPSCGDFACNGGESCSTCPQDCGQCSTCGDGWCDPAESCSSCAADCGACAVCGNGTCDAGEDCNSCAGDCGACPSCPGTDLGSNAPQTVTGSTAGLINALPSPCAYSNAPEATYSFTAPADGAYEINTFGSAYDTLLHVHDATCQGASLACNDDTAGLQSKVTVNLTAGQTIVIAVDGFGSSQGAFTLNVCQGACAPSCGDGTCNGSETCSSCQDDCGYCPVCGDGWCEGSESCSSCAADCGACPVCGNGQCEAGEDCSSCSGDCGVCPPCPGTDLGSTVPQTVSGSTAGLINALPSPCAYSNAPEATYSFTAPADGTYQINTSGSAYDTLLHVHDGTCQGASLACNDDSLGTLQSTVTVALTAGQTIIIVVDGFGSGQGNFTLNIQ